MSAPVRVGTNALSMTIGQSSFSTAATVPSDADFAVCFFSAWANIAVDMTALSINGVGMTLEVDQPSSGGPSMCVAWLANPATGSQTHAGSVGTNIEEGGRARFVYFDGVHPTTPVRQALADVATSQTDPVSLSFTGLAVDDLVTVMNQNYAPTGENPATTFSVGSPTNYVNNDAGSFNHTYDVDEANGIIGSLTVDATGENYAAIGGIALRAAVASPDLHYSSPPSFGINHTSGGDFSGTSASFSPPADSWLYLHAPVDSDAAFGDPVPGTPTNTGTALTWTLVGSRINASGGAVFVWRAYNANAQSGITVSISGTNGVPNATSPRTDATIRVWVGCATSQAGAAVATSVGTTDPGAPSVTTTRANSRVAGEGIDWNATGEPTSSDVFDPYHYDVRTSGMNVHKAANTPAASTSVSLDFNWDAAPIATYVVYEILAPLAASGVAPRAMHHRQLMRH